ncbi:MAG: hypothetical protein WBX15_15280 [Thermoanaerobaculia bacterium]
MGDTDDFDSEDYEEQIEQMIVDNGLLLHAVVNILLRKGIIAQGELDQEMEKLYQELEREADEDEDGE